MVSTVGSKVQAYRQIRIQVCGLSWTGRSRLGLAFEAGSGRAQGARQGIAEGQL